MATWEKTELLTPSFFSAFTGGASHFDEQGGFKITNTIGNGDCLVTFSTPIKDYQWLEIEVQSLAAIGEISQVSFYRDMEGLNGPLESFGAQVFGQGITVFTVPFVGTLEGFKWSNVFDSIKIHSIRAVRRNYGIKLTDSTDISGVFTGWIPTGNTGQYYKDFVTGQNSSVAISFIGLGDDYCYVRIESDRPFGSAATTLDGKNCNSNAQFQEFYFDSQEISPKNISVTAGADTGCRVTITFKRATFPKGLSAFGSATPVQTAQVPNINNNPSVIFGLNNTWAGFQTFTGGVSFPGFGYVRANGSGVNVDLVPNIPITDISGYGTMALENVGSWLSKAGNLAGLTNLVTARTNLGLGSMAVEVTGDWLSKAGNLAGLADLPTSRTNLGLGSMAVEATGAWLSKAGNLAGLADLPTARTNLGLGTMAVEVAANYLTKAGNLAGLASLPVSRTNIGLGLGDSPTFNGLTVDTAVTAVAKLSGGGNATGQLQFYDSGGTPHINGGIYSDRYASNSGGAITIHTSNSASAVLEPRVTFRQDATIFNPTPAQDDAGPARLYLKTKWTGGNLTSMIIFDNSAQAGGVITRIMGVGTGGLLFDLNDFAYRFQIGPSRNYSYQGFYAASTAAGDPERAQGVPTIVGYTVNPADTGISVKKGTSAAPVTDATIRNVPVYIERHIKNTITDDWADWSNKRLNPNLISETIVYGTDYSSPTGIAARVYTQEGLTAAVARSVTSITRVGATATATTAAAHGFVTNQWVTMLGATQPEYNGIVRVTVTGPTTFTYQVSGTPATPATGTITAKEEAAQPMVALIGMVQSNPLSGGTFSRDLYGMNLICSFTATATAPTTMIGAEVDMIPTSDCPNVVPGSGSGHWCGILVQSDGGANRINAGVWLSQTKPVDTTDSGGYNYGIYGYANYRVYGIYIKNATDSNGSGGIYVETRNASSVNYVVRAVNNGADQLNVNGDTTSPIWIRTGGLFRKLEVDPTADSGGVGFKRLRVAN